MSNLIRRPPRLTMVNLESGEEMEAPFNPTEFTKTIGVVVGRPAIPGLSHEPIQFGNTRNLRVDLQLFVSVETRAELAACTDLEKFLDAACYPRAGAGDIVSGGLPRVLVVWPRNFSFVCLFTEGVKVRSTRFNAFGDCIEKTFDLTYEEVRDGRITSEEVRDQGAVRAPGGEAS